MYDLNTHPKDRLIIDTFALSNWEAIKASSGLRQLPVVTSSESTKFLCSVILQKEE